MSKIHIARGALLPESQAPAPTGGQMLCGVDHGLFAMGPEAADCPECLDVHKRWSDVQARTNAITAKWAPTLARLAAGPWADAVPHTKGSLIAALLANDLPDDTPVFVLLPDGPRAALKVESWTKHGDGDDQPRSFITVAAGP